MSQFKDMPLSAVVQQKLAAAEFTTPTPVQEQAIPHALEGKDVLATAQTGTGKTLAFLIPIMEQLLKTKSRHVEALVLVPTRELAMQVAEQFDLIRTKATPRAAQVIGGMAENPQIRSIRAGARLIVATPGRLEDFLERRLVDLRKINILVLDEADRMLDMGFLPSIRRITAALPTGRQTMCFSATLEASVAGLVNDYMKQPVRVALGSPLKPAAEVELHAFEVAARDKGKVLRQLLHEEKGRSLVFARTKRGTERLAKELAREGFAAAMIHGDRSMSQRTGALNGFEEGRIKVLVATDVASRGIHVTDVTHVINYDLPNLPEDFVHRVGRTGRAGAKGRASTLVAGAEILDLRRIERALKLNMKRSQMDPDAPVGRGVVIKNTLASRRITALPGEVFV
jgi:ATP-dependent RNA helicase RhlE